MSPSPEAALVLLAAFVAGVASAGPRRVVRASGRVWWTIGTMMVIADIAGTRLALRHGNRFPRRLIAKTTWDART